MRAIWNRIESWLKANEPEILSDLLPGATGEEIRLAEKAMSVELPTDAKESYEIHDGQGGGSAPLMGEWQLLSLEAATRQWRIMKNLINAGEFTGAEGIPSGPVRAEWWDPAWIPVAHNGAGDFRCLDMDPAPGGASGQIVSFWHMNAEREVIADGFRAWLGAFVDDLEEVGKA